MLLAFTSCNKAFEDGMKSSDPKVIVPKAMEFYNKGKYDFANQLFEHSKKFVYGTAYAKQVDFYLAKSNLAFKNYPLAGLQFRDYANTYPYDSLAEYSQYMSAYCYYLGSLPYNLDQKDSKKALSELQKFIDKYPNSEKVKECNNYIIEIQDRFEKKEYENALTLYKIGRYRSSSVAFDNALNSYPDSKYKEKILYYSFQSKATFAFESFDYLKEDRLNDAMTVYKIFKKDFPNSSYLDDMEKVRAKINQEYDLLKAKNITAKN